MRDVEEVTETDMCNTGSKGAFSHLEVNLFKVPCQRSLFFYPLPA
jgi:hypothetical protein